MDWNVDGTQEQFSELGSHIHAHDVVQACHKEHPEKPGLGLPRRCLHGGRKYCQGP